MMAASEYLRDPPTTLVVRGISDHVDADKKEVDAIGNGALRRLAMANAWRLVCMLMRLGRLPRADARAALTPQAGPSAPPPPGAAAPPSAPGSAALKRWQAKLEYLLNQEPITVDPDAKYRLQHLIDEARNKIRELGGTA